MTRHLGPALDHGIAHFDGHELPFPEFPAFTHINAADCLPSHVLHPHRHVALEICYFERGRAIWTCGDQQLALGPGDCFVTRSGELHSGRADPVDPNRNWAVGFDPAALSLPGSASSLPAPQRDLDQAVIETRSAAAASPFAQRVVHGAHGAELICRRLLDECDRAPASGPARHLAVAMCQALLIELFVHVVRCALSGATGATGATGTPAHPVRDEIADILAWLPAHLAEPPDLTAMAARAGLSPMHFAAEFRRATGRTPLEHVTRLRIDAAAVRLRDDRHASITAIALDYGFCSSQYFSAVFRRTLGVTPSQWRRGQRR